MSKDLTDKDKANSEENLSQKDVAQSVEKPVASDSCKVDQQEAPCPNATAATESSAEEVKQNAEDATRNTFRGRFRNGRGPEFEAKFKDAFEQMKDAEKTVKKAAQKAHVEAASAATKVKTDLEDAVQRLKEKVTNLELEKAQELRAFQEKAATFQTKAQIEINKFKDNLLEKIEREKAEHGKYSIQKLVEDLADPLLNFEVAIQSGANQEGATGAYVKGFSMLLEQVNNALQAHGVSLIEPQIGELYNSDIHYAIGREIDETKAPDTILAVKKKGYRIHQRVIKPAVVVTSIKAS